MWWIVKYEIYDYDVHEWKVAKVEKDTWTEVWELFKSCVEQDGCELCEVTCMWGDHPYGENPIVLNYHA